MAKYNDYNVPSCGLGLVVFYIAMLLYSFAYLVFSSEIIELTKWAWVAP